MKKFAMLAPAPIRGSGGVARIYTFAEALARNDFAIEVHVFDCSGKSAQQVAQEARTYYGVSNLDIRCGSEFVGEYDFVLATRWDTASRIAAVPSRHRLYLVQDFEPSFNLVGDGWIAAQNSYMMGLQPITYGRWLAKKLASNFGCTPYWLDFNSSPQHFKLETEYRGRKETNPSICFIYQSDKPRRCPQMGLEALAIVKRLRPDVQIHIVGTDEAPHVDFSHINHGVVNTDGLNALYNNCLVGLCLSASNPSCNPFDMMAAGLPSVELFRENNLFDLPPDSIQLAHQTAGSLAEAVLALLSDRSKRQRMSDLGIKFMRERATRPETESFLSIISEIERGEERPKLGWELSPSLARRTAIVARADLNESVRTYLNSQISEPNFTGASPTSSPVLRTYNLVPITATESLPALGQTARRSSVDDSIPRLSFHDRLKFLKSRLFRAVRIVIRGR